MSMFLTIFIILSIIFVLIGDYGRKKVLQSNPCGMTYSTRDRKRISFDSTVDGVSFKDSIHFQNNASDTVFKLWKYSNPRSKKLNMHPVLFIPGNMGNADQVRSFASYMHNGDDYFQYFALDFNESLSAIHGSLILQQAIYLNEALKQITLLYKNHDGFKDIPKIILIGHSIGGMVARTAIILDNHPRCIVSDIIMIGTPNRYPAYSPDSSMEILYESVNKAWMNSFYNESTNCKASSAAAQSYDEYYDNNEIVTADYKCPACTARIRLISITGGDIDILVPPDLTRLEGIAPFPVNSTSMSTKAPSVFSQVLNMMMFPVNIPKFIFANTKGYFSSFMGGSNSTTANNNTSINITAISNNANNNNTTQSIEIDSCVEGNMTCNSDHSKDKDIRNITKPSYYERITLDEWKLHMTNFIEPKHVSIRTSDLLDVGYPIDHDAMLWCKELVKTITTAMRKLTKYPYDESSQSFKSFNIYKLFKYNSSKKIPGIENMIEPVRDYLSRKEYYNMWKQADFKDHKHIQSVVPGGFIMLLAIIFVSSHLPKVAVCYVVISCISITIPLVRSLTGSAITGSTLNDFNTLQPWIHLHLDVLSLLPDKFLMMALPLPLYELVTRLFPSSRVFIIISITIALKVLYDSWKDSQYSFRFYGNIVEWIMAYGLAIGIRLLFLVIIYGMRSICSAINISICTCMAIIKRTIWTKFTRKIIKKYAKINFTVLEILMGILIVCGSAGVIVYYTYSRINELKLGLYYLAVFKITSVLAICFSLWYSLICPPQDSESYFYHTQFILLYLPLPMLLGSSLYYSAILLFAHNAAYINTLNLYNLFMPEELNLNMMLVAICIHLLLARRKGYFTYKPENNSIIADIFGSKNNEEDYSNVDKSKVTTNKNECYHEDGGIDAIYEKLTNKDEIGPLVEIAPGVLIGPTYRVISCNCSKKYISDQSKWCEWCLCEKCSGNKIKTSSYENNDTGSQPFSNEFSTNFLHLIGIFMIAVYAFQNAVIFPHKLFNVLGFFSLSYLARDISLKLKIMNLIK